MTVKIFILFAILIFCYGSSTNFVEAQHFKEQSTINRVKPVDSVLNYESYNYINERPSAQKVFDRGTQFFPSKYLKIGLPIKNAKSNRTPAQFLFH